MAIQFPADPSAQVPLNTFGPETSPLANATNDIVFTWDGKKWTGVLDTGGGGGGDASITVSETPPVSPAQGALWWDSSDDGGRLWLWYEDGNTNQWVEASPNSGGDSGGGGDTYWARNSTTLSPANAGDDVDLGNIQLDADGRASFASNKLAVDDNGTLTLGPNLPSSAKVLIQNDGEAAFVGDQGTITLNYPGDLFRVNRPTTNPAEPLARFVSNVGGSAVNVISFDADGSGSFAGSVSIGGKDAAHTIDEYEEGTWTPTYVSGLATGTFKDQSGTYTRIGNLVYLSMTTLFTVGGGTAQLTAPLVIGGLPFVPVAANAGGVSGESNFGGQLPWTPNSVTAGGTQMTVNAASYPTGANMNRLNVAITYQI